MLRILYAAAFSGKGTRFNSATEDSTRVSVLMIDALRDAVK